IYWRTLPIDETYVHVDQDGVRATWHAPDAGAPFRIWMLGGSLAWGYGARDDFTVESYLAKELSAAGYHVEITNFAERGYVSEQGMILLHDELIRCPAPDLVISLDGVNDVDAAWWNGTPGVSIHEDNREREFNLTNNHCTSCRAELYRAALVGFLQWT